MSQSPRPGRVVMVVGASSGIGLATVRQLAAAGEEVVMVSRDRDALERAAADLPGQPLVVAADVLDRDAVDTAVLAALDRHGRLDAVITTAQVMAYGTVEEVPIDVFDHVVDTSIKGTINLVNAVLPVFRSQGGGTLVVVNSLLSQIAVPSMSAYCTAKWGQLGLVRSLQLELRAEPDIHVCLVSPGAIDTPIYAQAATYAGSRGSAPPPVVAPTAVARAACHLLDRPRRMVQVGPVNALSIIGFRFLPFVYDRLAPLLVRWVVLRGPATGPDAGNVLAPVASGESLRGGWTLFGRLRQPGRRPRWRWREEQESQAAQESAD